jgi:hypothetical protein
MLPGMYDDAWDEIERLGRQFGAEAEAIRKWRVRGVPPKWQLRFISDPSGQQIDRAAFSNPPGSRRAAARKDDGEAQADAA